MLRARYLGSEFLKVSQPYATVSVHTLSLASAASSYPSKCCRRKGMFCGIKDEIDGSKAGRGGLPKMCHVRRRVFHATRHSVFGKLFCS